MQISELYGFSEDTAEAYANDIPRYNDIRHAKKFASILEIRNRKTVAVNWQNGNY